MYSIKRKFTLKCKAGLLRAKKKCAKDCAKKNGHYANIVAASAKLSGLPTSKSVAPV